MKSLFVFIIFTIICFSAQAQENSNSIGRPELSNNEIGIQFGGNSAIGNGVLLSFNKYMSEKHILHFSFTPGLGFSESGILGGFEFWNEYRSYTGKSGSFFLSHGLELNVGDRNKNLMFSSVEANKKIFGAGIGYSLGIGQIINDRLTFTAAFKPRFNYIRTSYNGVTHEFLPELNLAIGVNYRFK